MTSPKKIDYILFDAANTLIYKPDLWDAILTVLKKHNYTCSLEKIQLHHRLLSELTDFPDRTSKDFYSKFNSELLISLGIIPSPTLLEDIFQACSYLPWLKFEDTAWLNDINISIGVISNFNNNLPGLLDRLFGPIFSHVIVSETASIRKPDLSFYQHAVDVIGLAPQSILYVGDSLKLDIIPAKSIGMKAVLIDRMNIFLNSGYSINELSKIRDYLA